MFTDNIEGSVCPSYPQYIVVPQAMSDKEIVKCAKYRSDMRFPALTYYHKKNGASIWRSGQALTSSTNKADKKMINSIIDTLYVNAQSSIKFKDVKREEARLHIFDVRAKGAMSVKYDFNYPSTWMWLYEVEGIQKTRESYIKLLQLNNNLTYSSQQNHIRLLTGKKWLTQLDTTGWLQSIAYLLSEVNMIVDSVRVM